MFDYRLREEQEAVKRWRSLKKQEGTTVVATRAIERFKEAISHPTQGEDASNDTQASETKLTNPLPALSQFASASGNPKASRWSGLSSRVALGKLEPGDSRITDLLKSKDQVFSGGAPRGGGILSVPDLAGCSSQQPHIVVETVRIYSLLITPITKHELHSLAIYSASRRFPPHVLF